MKLTTEMQTKALGVVFVRKDESALMRTIGWVLGAWFMERFWTTLRFPFCDPRIYYPTSVQEFWDDRYDWIIQHELVHARQFRSWYGPAWLALLYVLAPLPVLFSGRWFIERRAFAQDIRYGKRTPESAAQTLWDFYVWPWPKSLMIKWFRKETRQ